MKIKKTCNIEELTDWCNNQLSRTDSFATIDFKQGIISVIEHTLHRNDVYSGFMFANNNDSEHGTPGYYNRRYFHKSGKRNQLIVN